MSVYIDVGFIIGLLLLATLPLSTVSGRLERAMTGIALTLFRERVETEGRHRHQRKRALHSIHSTTTYPVYASRTLLYTVIVGIAGSLVAVWFIQQGLLLAIESEQALRGALPPELGFLVPTNFAALSVGQLFVLLFVSSATFGTGGAGLTYYIRWGLVSSEADKREIMIDESLARTIAFIYALSRSGMVFPEIMRTVGANRKAFGQSAEEIGVIVKDMDLFGADLVSAMERIAERTPSEQFSDFAENFANVLQSGQNVSDYLREQYEQHQSERVENQEQLLELFTALGEGYVAGLVAGPLFFITILVIFGILTGGILEFLQVITYLLIPVANIGFVFYLDSISEPLKSFDAPIQQKLISRNVDARLASDPGAAPVARPDGGTTPARYSLETNRIRFNAYNRFERFRATVLNPFETVVRRPRTLLWVTVPIALLLFVVRAWPTLSGEFAFSLSTMDDLAIQSGLIIVASFAVAQELYTRRLRGVEAAIPDLLDRLASTNDAGMTFTESLRRVDKSDLGVLDIEVNRLLADINWGARTERALYRFNERIGSSTVARIVALITNAMMASGHLGPVIRIAADEAREDRRLSKKRRQEMVMYVIIIYLSFVVFIGIAIALQEVLIPAMPTAEEIGTVASSSTGGAVGGAGALPIDPVEGKERAKYTLTLFHAAIIQSVVSGFVAGQMGEGSVLDGAKHVTVMVTIAYVVFLLLG
ncbi:MAG: type II secretion system F family protein [Halobacteriales archaeon]|nr:type II secretion system F family protein [Halobacteriales archaeon]